MKKYISISVIAVLMAVIALPQASFADNSNSGSLLQNTYVNANVQMEQKKVDGMYVNGAKMDDNSVVKVKLADDLKYKQDQEKKDKEDNTRVDYSYNADINYDGTVNTDDLLLVIQNWGKCPAIQIEPSASLDKSNADSKIARIANPCRADINGDRMVDRTDLNLVLKYWGAAKPIEIIKSFTVSNPEKTTNQTVEVSWTTSVIANANITAICSETMRLYSKETNTSFDCNSTTPVVIAKYSSQTGNTLNVTPSGNKNLSKVVFTLNATNAQNANVKADSETKTVVIKPMVLPTPVRADINGDGVVNVTDLLAVIQNWGKCPAMIDPAVKSSACTAADLNHDSIVDREDLMLVIKNWTNTEVSR